MKSPPIETKKERKKKHTLWVNFEQIRSQETFLFLYLLHKPDYPYNIATTLIKLRKAGIMQLDNFKTLLRAGDVATKLRQMEEKGVIIATNPIHRHGRESKTYGINPEIFLEFFYYKEENEESDNITVLLNILDLFRSLLEFDNSLDEIWLSEIENLKKYDHFTIVCYFIDSVVEAIGGAYRNIKENDDYWRDHYLDRICFVKNNPTLKKQLIDGIDKIEHKRSDVPKLKNDLTTAECIDRIYDIQHRLLEIMESSIGVERGFKQKFTFLNQNNRENKNE